MTFGLPDVVFILHVCFWSKSEKNLSEKLLLDDFLEKANSLHLIAEEQPVGFGDVSGTPGGRRTRRPLSVHHPWGGRPGGVRLVGCGQDDWCQRCDAVGLLSFHGPWFLHLSNGITIVPTS